MDESFREYVRAPADDEPVAEGWRPIDPERDDLGGSGEPSSGLDYFHALKHLDTDDELGPDSLYYWRSAPRRRSTNALPSRQMADPLGFAAAAVIIGVSVLSGMAAAYVLGRLVRWFRTH